MSTLAKPLARLISELSRLPGIGPKTASRLTFYLLRAPGEQAQALAQAIAELREKITECEICFNLSDENPCNICSDPQRERSVICVVEEPLDVLAIERTGQYHGRYHVLHGAISPVDGVGPEDLKISELPRRLDKEKIEEIIMATNPNLEGESTAMYIHRLLVPRGIKITRIAHGLPVGGDLEYADQVTLTRALEGRREM